MLDLFNKADNYEDLHMGLRYLYDSLDFEDENVSKFKVLLIDYCSDIVLLARNHEFLDKVKDNKKSREALLDYCKKHVA